jgi:hypothetical protein
MNSIKKYFFEENETEIPSDLRDVDIDKLNEYEYITGKKNIDNEWEKLTTEEKKKIMNERKIINNGFNKHQFPRTTNIEDLPGFGTDYRKYGVNYENGGKKTTKKPTKKRTKQTTKRTKPTKKRTKHTKKPIKNII